MWRMFVTDYLSLLPKFMLLAGMCALVASTLPLVFQLKREKGVLPMTRWLAVLSSLAIVASACFLHMAMPYITRDSRIVVSTQEQWWISGTIAANPVGIDLTMDELLAEMRQTIKVVGSSETVRDAYQKKRSYNLNFDVYSSPIAGYNHIQIVTEKYGKNVVRAEISLYPKDRAETMIGFRYCAALLAALNPPKTKKEASDALESLWYKAQEAAERKVSSVDLGDIRYTLFLTPSGIRFYAQNRNDCRE